MSLFIALATLFGCGVLAASFANDMSSRGSKNRRAVENVEPRTPSIVKHIRKKREDWRSSTTRFYVFSPSKNGAFNLVEVGSRLDAIYDWPTLRLYFGDIHLGDAEVLENSVLRKPLDSGADFEVYVSDIEITKVGDGVAKVVIDVFYK